LRNSCLTKLVILPFVTAMPDHKAIKKRTHRHNSAIHKSGAVMRFSRAVLFRKKQLWKKKLGSLKTEPKVRAAKKGPETRVKKIGGAKNGTERKVAVQKSTRLYATQGKRVRHMKKSGVRKARPVPKLRSSITPGTVLILLAGRHKGKRVVFLKQLASGLLLVTGPYAINGCPLRRISQVFVIATKTRLNISEVKLPALDDAYFKRVKPDRRNRKKEAGDIFAKKKEQYKITEQRKADQVVVDKQVVAAIKKHQDKKLIKEYLKSLFCLRNKQYPHKLVF